MLSHGGILHFAIYPNHCSCLTVRFLLFSFCWFFCSLRIIECINNIIFILTLSFAYDFVVFLLSTVVIISLKLPLETCLHANASSHNNPFIRWQTLPTPEASEMQKKKILFSPSHSLTESPPPCPPVQLHFPLQ